MVLFLKRVTFSSDGPWAGPSAGVPEEGLALIGDDSSQRVLVPEGLQVRQDMEVEDRDTDVSDLVQT